jgi:hypothetical protein
VTQSESESPKAQKGKGIMKKVVKGKIEKHYCDRCRKNIYDYIPKEPTVKFMGQWIPEFTPKRYCDSHRVMPSRSKGIKGGEYCTECYNEISKENKQ